MFSLACLVPLAAARAEDRVINLFDGKSLAGWTTAAGKPVTKGWAAQDGALVRTGGGGSIFTADHYADFDLSFQWKIARRGNSGVKYRVAHYEKGVYGHPGWLGCEYQIYDDDARRPGPKFSSGAIYELFAPSADKKLRPVGEFNDARIIVRGSKIEHWLNGAKIVDVDTTSDQWKKSVAASKFGDIDGFFQNRTGRIELQDHGSRVWFRSLVLRRLD